MKGLNEESIAQINDPEKLRYLLSGVVQKNSKQLRKIKILQRQLKNAKNELNTVTLALQESKINCESNYFYKFENEFEKIRADYNESAFSSLFNIFQNLNGKGNDIISSNIQELTKEIEAFKIDFQEKKNKQIEDFKSIISDKDKIIKEKEQKINELKEEIENIESSPIPKDIEDLLSEKDQSISKLRNLIQRYVKSDQIKQQQIDEQQSQIQQLLKNPVIKESGNLVTESNKKDYFSLENEVIELRKQLSNNSLQNFHEIESKNEKLTAMLEKSNKLYTQLNEKYISLQQSVSHLKNVKLSINKNLLYEVFNSDSQAGRSMKKKSKKASFNDSAVMASLRKTLLQFFLTNEENQENLIPVVLEIVGCNKEQIEGALANYKLRQQLINKAGSFFGLFS